MSNHVKQGETPETPANTGFGGETRETVTLLVDVSEQKRKALLVLLTELGIPYDINPKIVKDWVLLRQAMGLPALEDV